MVQKPHFGPNLALLVPSFGHRIFLSFYLFEILDIVSGSNPVQYKKS